MDSNELKFTQEKINKLPLKWMVYPFMISLGFLFFVLSMSNLYSYFQGNIQTIKIPFLFYINTFVIIGCSFFLEKSFKSFSVEKVFKSFQNMKVAMVFVLLFILIQIAGWIYMHFNNMSLYKGSISSSYFYIITFLHVFHLLIGLLFLIIFFIEIRKMLQDEVQYLLQISNPFFKEKFKLLLHYWHFLGAVWLYMILFFSMLQ